MNNEVSIGYLEVSVHQKAVTKKQRAAGRPVSLFLFSYQDPGPNSLGEGPDTPLPPHPEPVEGEDELSVALDPMALSKLTSALRNAFRQGACLPSIFLPLLLRRVDKFPEADITVKYSTGPGHRHYRTLTIPLHFHLKEVSETDLRGLDLGHAATHWWSVDPTPRAPC